MKSKNKKRNKIIKTVVASVAVFIILLLLMFNSGIGFLRQISGYIVIPAGKRASPRAFRGTEQLSGHSVYICRCDS